MKTPSPSATHEKRPSQKPAKSLPPRESPVLSAPAPTARGQRILLADDDPGVRGSLSDVLVFEGYVVIPANDGQQALELVASEAIDLVLLDLNMPRKNGWDTFEQLTREHPFLPVIIVTARPNSCSPPSARAWARCWRSRSTSPRCSAPSSVFLPNPLRPV